MSKYKNFFVTASVLLAVMVYYVFIMPLLLPKTPKHTPIPVASQSPVVVAASPSPTIFASGEQPPQLSNTPILTPQPSATPPPTPVPVREPEKLTASSKLFDVTYTTAGGSIESLSFVDPTPELVKEDFRQYKAPNSRTDQPMQLLARLSAAKTSFRLLFNTSGEPQSLASIEEDNTAYEMIIDPSTPLVVTFKGVRGNFIIEKIFTLSDSSYDISLDVKITNTAGTTEVLNYLLVGAAGVVPEGIEDLRQTLDFSIGHVDARGIHSVSDTTVKKLNEDFSMKFFGSLDKMTIDWIGTSDHFFTVFLNPATDVKLAGAFARIITPDDTLVRNLPTFKANMPNIESGVILDTLSFEAGETKTQSFAILPAPKYYTILNKYEDEEYSKVVKLGFFGMVARLILNMLEAIHFVVRNYGIAIIILTILIQILMHPLTRKQYSSMMKMQKLQPLIKEAQKRFKKDQKKLGEVTMAIYQQTGVNPLGSCLPLLLQLPIFFALYSAFYSCIELRHASFLWIPDLSGPERLPLWTTLPLVGNTINILPFLMTIVWFIQQSTTPKPTDPSQQMTYKIMKFMPLIFFFLFYSMPSGLVLYWFIRNLVYIGETLWIKRGLRLQEEQGKMNFDKLTLDTILKEVKTTSKNKQRSQ